MVSVFHHKNNPRFSIDDAFEEEDDENISVNVNVYGSTASTSTEKSLLKPNDQPSCSRNTDNLVQQNTLLNAYRPVYESKRSLETLTNSDEYFMNGNGPQYTLFDCSHWCCSHPKVKRNWKTVVAAAILLVLGLGLLALGLLFVHSPDPNEQGAVFIIAGLICFIPGAYHVFYIYFAAIGRQGYNFYHLPLFN